MWQRVWGYLSLKLGYCSDDTLHEHTDAVTLFIGEQGDQVKLIERIVA